MEGMKRKRFDLLESAAQLDQIKQQRVVVAGEDQVLRLRKFQRCDLCPGVWPHQGEQPCSSFGEARQLTGGEYNAGMGGCSVMKQQCALVVHQGALRS